MVDYFVVVEDPRRLFWEGSIVDGATASRLREEGVDLLPVDPKLFGLGGVCGYARRGWGSGISLAHARPVNVAPLTLQVVARLREVHWIARVVPDPEYRGKPASGMLRLANDGTQGHAQAGRLGQVLRKPPDVSEWGKADERGGWTIGGAYEADLSEGFLGLALYGSAPGMSVLWAAVSQS